ncbi:MAG TPA: sugar kinase [Xanthobacteraceae bacterium]
MNAPRALFIGHSYIDVTFLTDHIPTGDEKYVAEDYAVSFGGNAVTAAFCCAKLSAEVDLIATHADDWLGRMFLEMADRYSVHIHPRAVETSSLSFIMPNHGKRAIVRCRDDEYREPFPKLDVRPFAALHIDGHQSDAALYYAKACREAGILTSLDGGGVRSNTSELLKYIDVAVVSERFCEQMDMTAQKMLSHLRAQGCKVGGVTRGEHGLLWYEKDSPPRTTPALNVPPHRVIDTSGAGDVFHGAYVWSYLSHRKRSWAEHFRFASAASAFKIQKLGNEAGLPTQKDIENVIREFGDQVLEARPARENTSAMR